MNASLWIHSLSVALGAWLIAVVSGGAVALAIAGAGPRWQHTGSMAAVVTLALPPFLPASCWLEWTAIWRTSLGAERSTIAMLPLTAMVLGLGLWPLTTLLLLGAWQRVQREWLEAEPRLRGFAVLQHLHWPASRDALRLASVLTLTLALANFTVPTLFQVRVFTEEFWIRYNSRFDLHGALAATWPLWLMPLLLAWVLRRQDVAWPRLQAGAGLAPSLLTNRLGTPVTGLTRALAAVVILAALALPMGQLCLNPRTWSELPGALAAGRVAVTNSWWAASMTALATVGSGLLLGARGRARSSCGGIAATALRRAGWLLFLLPGVFVAVGLIVALNRPGLTWLYAGFGMVWLALGLRYFGPAWSGVEVARGAVDPTLAETSRLLGAHRLDHFQLVTWPQSGRMLLATAYAIYLLCLWDVETLVLVQPPGGETLSLRIFNLLHYGHAGQVNALCVITLGLALLPWVLFQALSTGFSRARPLLARAAGLGAVLSFSLLFPGCSPSNLANTPTYPIHSRLFSAVQIIGSRGVAPGQFNKPRSLTCDRDDHLYVADITGRIQKFAPDGRFLLQWQMPQTDLGKPKGMGLDPAGNILVVEPHYQRVNHFRGDGTLVTQWGRRGTEPGEFLLPRCITVSSQGDYFLGEYTLRERVQRFSLAADRSTTPPAGAATNTPFSLVRVWGKPGQGDGELNRAEGIAIGPDDAVYVADSCNHRIQVFDPDGRFLRAHGQAGAEAGRLSFPYDLRVEPDGQQIVCEFGNSRISVFDATDRLVETIGQAGPAPGEFANPWSICLDSQGNLYVADSQNHRVQKLLRRPETRPARRATGALTLATSSRKALMKTAAPPHP